MDQRDGQEAGGFAPQDGRPPKKPRVKEGAEGGSGKPERYIAGTTSVFVKDATSWTFQKHCVSSREISKDEFPEVHAIQTLQYQKMAKHLRGQVCFIHVKRQGWKMFVVWQYKIAHLDTLLGYFYKGKSIRKENLVALPIKRNGNNFYWVNLNSEMFVPGSLGKLEHPITEQGKSYYGDLNPSMVFVPTPDQDQVYELVSPHWVERTNQSSPYSETLEKLAKFGVSDGLENWEKEDNKYYYAEHRRGLGKRLHPVFQTNKRTTVPFLTVFLPDDYCVPYKEYVDSKKLSVLAPYAGGEEDIEGHPFHFVKYAVIDCKEMEILQDRRPEEYNRLLNGMSLDNVKLFQPTFNQPFRICRVNKDEFEDLRENPELYSWKEREKKETVECHLKLVKTSSHGSFLYGTTDLPNPLLPGICLSMWRHSSHIKPVDLKFTEIVAACFGRSFGDRSTTANLGSNGYKGTHWNPRVNHRPETKPGMRISNHYARQTDKHIHNIPLINKHLKGQAMLALDVVRTFGDNYQRFIGYKTADRIICTQGLEYSRSDNVPKTHQVQRCLSFCNKPHIDECDEVDKEVYEEWFKAFESLNYNEVKKRSTRLDYEAAKKHVMSWFRKIEKEVGIGLPTTCGYCVAQGDNSDIVDIDASYIEFNFAIPINNQCVHHAFAWAFEHCTAMTIAYTNDNKVLIHNRGDPSTDVNVFAWGNGGGTAHAVVRNQIALDMAIMDVRTERLREVYELTAGRNPDDVRPLRLDGNDERNRQQLDGLDDDQIALIYSRNYSQQELEYINERTTLRLINDDNSN